MISIDNEVERKAGMKISELVRRSGWPAFRETERVCFEALRHKWDVILDCGGGAPENPANMQAVVPDSLVVWVDALQGDIIARLQKDINRPLLSESDPASDVVEHLRRRMPIYRKYAQLVVNSSLMGIDEMVDLITAYAIGAND